MKIKKIIKDKNDNYKIVLEDEEIITSDEIILKYNLLYKDSIDSHLLESIKKESAFFKQYNKVLNYVLKKLRSEKEVRNYMTNLELTDKQQKVFLTKLKDKDLLNDYNYLKAYVSEKVNLTNDGPLKITSYLEKQDIDKSLIDEVLSEYNDVIKEKLFKLVSKKKRQNQNYSDYVYKQKVIYYFLNLGYSEEMIEDVYNEIPSNDLENIKNREFERLKNKLSNKYYGEELERQVKIRLAQKGFFLD